MDELGLSFRTLPQKGLVALFVAANGSKVFDPIFVWRSQKSRCFAKLKKIYHPHGVHYFVNAKAWITTKITQKVLKVLDKKMIAGREMFCFS